MTNQQAPEIYTLHTVPNKGERPWSGIYTVRADAEHDAKVMRDVTGRHWSVVRLVVADTAATPTGPIARYKIGYATDDWGMRSSTPSGIPDHAGAWVRYEDHIAALVEAQQPAPSAACPVDNNFDHQTAADVLNGKTVSDETMRKFVAVARWAHDDRVGLRATLLSVRGELASREAEIALLKKALMDAEASQPSPTPQADSRPAPVDGANWQDISTAPKDGTRFVAVGNNYGLYSEAQHTCIAQWFRGCWMELSDWNEASELKYLTHWMPLPPLLGSAASATADSLTAPAAGAEEVDKALNYYTQAFMARAMGWTREHGDAMPDARTKLYSAISSYARGLSTTYHTPQAADSVTAPANEAVAYLDIGAGGYIDLGTDLSEEALSRLPKGRHALTIAGTYGIDGYTPTTSADSLTAPAAYSGNIEQELAMLIRRIVSSARRNCEDGSNVLKLANEAWAYLVRKGLNGSPLRDAGIESDPTPLAQADSVLEDAARYRWLRQHWFTMLSSYQRGITFKLGGPRWSDITEAELDAAIDAARKQGGA